MDLLTYRKNNYSQNGEDGVLEIIFQKIAKTLPKEKWCVEFGAWDGKYLSNTFSLVQQGWKAVYIEGDREKYYDLLETSKKWKNIYPLHGYVGYKKEDQNKLDNLLKKTVIPNDYELLSIDIDSFDLDVWEAYSGMPKVVVIEIDSSLKPGIYNRYKIGSNNGNSFSSTLLVAKKKGYELACHTGNLIFIRKDLIDKIDLDKRYKENPDFLFLDNNKIFLNIIKKFSKSFKKILKYIFRYPF